MLLFQDALILNKASVDRGIGTCIYIEVELFCCRLSSLENAISYCNLRRNQLFLLTNLISFSVRRFWPLLSVQEANLLVKEIRESGNLVLASLVDEADKYSELVLCLRVCKPVAYES